MEGFDVVVIGAGAAGMMCAAEAARRGRRVLVLDHARAPGEKIRISGGGRCNFTNLGVHPSRFLSVNPRFCISALSRYTPADFVALVQRHGVGFHEKHKGQLFCDRSAEDLPQDATRAVLAICDLFGLFFSECSGSSGRSKILDIRGLGGPAPVAHRGT